MLFIDPGRYGRYQPLAVVPEPGGGGQGGHWPPQYLADQLTLFEPGGADYPYLLLLAPSMFFTFRHHCLKFPPSRTSFF